MTLTETIARARRAWEKTQPQLYLELDDILDGVLGPAPGTLGKAHGSASVGAGRAQTLRLSERVPSPASPADPRDALDPIHT